MSSNTDYARLKRLANRAEELLCDADFKEMLADLKNRAIRGWADTKPLAMEMREAYWQRLQAIGELEGLMKGYGEEYRLQERKDGK